MSSIENAEKEFSTKAAGTAFQLAWGAISKFGRKAWDRGTVGQTMEAYAERYILRHGQLKVLGMTNPVALSTIYTAVQMIAPGVRNAYGDTNSINDSLRNPKHFSIGTSKGTPGMLVANRESFLNILGAPGAGKSTFLKRVGLEALLPRHGWSSTVSFGDSIGEYIPECFPIYIELRRFKREPVDLIKAIQAEFEVCGLPESESFVKLCLSQGNLLLLLDGVDEVPADKLDSAIQHIADFADEYHKNRFITSCRTAFYKTYFRKFVDVELTLFDNKQIQTFATNWFGSEVDRANETARDFLALLFSNEHRLTLELSRTPLLLTFLCLVYDTAQKFPANRSSLYRRALMILMENWAAEKRVHNSPVYADLHVELEMELLSEIAACAYVNDQILFSQRELIDHITRFMRNTLDAPATLDSRRILEAIQIQQGLVVERAIDVYTFSHLTIQEYLTAEYFHTPARMGQLVCEHMFDERWREVFLLSSGLSGADELILSMLDECDTFLRKNPLALRCVQWASDIVPQGDSRLADTLLRVFLLSFPLRFKRYEMYGCARMEDPADDLLQVLAPDFLKAMRLPRNLGLKSAAKWLRHLSSRVKMKVPIAEVEETLRQLTPGRPLVSMLPGTRFKYVKQINKVFYDALGLDEELQNLSRSRVGELQSLFYGYKLIVDCKNAALRISTQVWEAVCIRMGSFPLYKHGKAGEDKPQRAVRAVGRKTGSSLDR